MKIAERSVPAAGTAELERAFRGRFRTVIENSAIPSPVGIAIKCPLSLAVRNCSVSRTIRLSTPAGAAVNQQSRIANNVDEENVRDLQVDLFFDLSGHEMREGRNVLSVCESFSFLESSGKSRTRTSTNNETDKRAAGWNPLASFSQAV